LGALCNGDDQLHSPSEEKGWRESYYFNFVDIKNGISGFTTIGLMPVIQRREFVFAIFHGGRRIAHFVESAGPFDPSKSNPLSDGIVTYEQVAPMKRWRLAFSKGDAEADLLWEGRFPAFPFGACSGTSWDGHFEQSGSVSGTVRIAGRTIHVKGLGQRDKSWGPRDWHISSWFALHAQFRGISIGLRRDDVGASSVLSGGISSPAGHIPIASMELQTVCGDDGAPKGATSRIAGSDGKAYTLHSELIHPCSFVKFSRPFPGGRTDLFEAMAVHRCDELGEEGTGLLEWLFTSRDAGGKG